MNNSKNDVKEKFGRNNHYVPRMYLKQWADSDNKICLYNLLVSNENVPLWSKQSVSRTASMDNLYVRMDGKLERDDFEDYFAQNFEDPASEPLRKACNGERLNTKEWITLIDFVTAQHVRTVSFYIRMQPIVAERMQSVIDNVFSEIENGIVDFRTKDDMNSENLIDMSLLPLDIRITKKNEDDPYSFLSVETIAGKSSWLMSIKRFLEKGSVVTKWMRGLHWSVIDSHPDVKWPTTDTPLVISNPHKHQGSFIGVGEPGNVFIFPISPEKALMARNGKRLSYGFKPSYEQSLLIKQAIVNNALLFIYSSHEDNEIVNMRQRTVSESEYKGVHASLKQWHANYLSKEVPLLHQDRNGGINISNTER